MRARARVVAVAFVIRRRSWRLVPRNNKHRLAEKQKAPSVSNAKIASSIFWLPKTKLSIAHVTYNRVDNRLIVQTIRQNSELMLFTGQCGI